MKKLVVFLFAIFLFWNVCANCEEGQIDINSASAEELDRIIHVGPAVAGYIIDSRPFDSVDELVDVKYISENYLNDIKEEGLACVKDETEKEENYEEETQDEDYEEEDENSDDSYEEDYDENDEEEEIPEINYEEISTKTESGKGPVEKIKIKKEVINLVPKDIKKEDSLEKLETKNYAVYGLAVFSVILIMLFVLKLRTSKQDEIE
jgi:hypothetical protein